MQNTDRRLSIQNNIITGMSEGVMAIRYDGRIELVNPAALSILGKEEADLIGRPFALCFFDDQRNDAFTETVLDAIRDRERSIESCVPYFAGQKEKQLRVVSSCLREDGAVAGVILVVSDITELTELRDAMKAMDRIRSLNSKLELRNRLLTETFGRYLSDDIVREILDTPDGMKMGGSRRSITVLMSDLRGFTMMSERMEPQSLITMLNHYFAEMYEEIGRYKGTIIEFLGDGMFIVFGAPSVSQTHASDAVACAIAMQNRMPGVNAWNEAHGYEPLSMGIGINTGDVILGNIGSEKRTKYGVMGPTVNLAGRIEGYTTGGKILISPTTRAAVPEELVISDSFLCSPKGVSEEITISRVTGIKGAYQLCLTEDPDELRPLPDPLPLFFRLLREKNVESRQFSGFLVSVSQRQAVLQTKTPLSVYDNLYLEIGSGLYAKAVEETKEGVRVIFTAKPPEFSAWLERITRA